ncbi:hypothetical protein DRN73_08020 [Candidatus Pacearchaeota archaeon]|nr:MAG: hypothetical protein DRN73_08020 [Candidatus Pacearchaeota archaeon]
MKDVLDVWFDSGITSLIVLKDNEFPSDVYLEGSDQHRGWFNASLMVSIALKGEPPYKSVITHGWVLDEQGRAMHKSLGNVIMPSEIVNKYGAELLRLWVAQSDYTKDVRLGKEILQRLVEAYRKIRNTIRFMLANLHDFNPEKNLLSYNDLLDIDKYILWKFENLKREVKKHYDNYEFFKIYQKVYNFCISDLSSFWLDITKDRLYTWYYDSIGRRSAQSVIYMILKEFLIILSPILSFTTEEAWSYLPGKKEESVFLENYPSENENWFSFKFYKDYEIIYHLREKVNKLIEEMRNKNIISDRLEGKISLIPKNEELKQIIEKHKEELAEIFVVSQVDIGKHFSDGVSVSFEDIDLFGKHADGQKCQRCWMWHVDIKEGLCPKCRLNLSKYEDSLA